MSPELPAPASPPDGEPPGDLIVVSETLRHPQVSRIGITATEEGHWALFVTVPKGVKVPLKDVEAAAGRYPVVYDEADPDNPVRAF